jgi:hypothetical protein
MWLNIVVLPDAVNVCPGYLQVRCQRAHAPMRAPITWTGLQRGTEYSCATGDRGGQGGRRGPNCVERVSACQAGRTVGGIDGGLRQLDRRPIRGSTERLQNRALEIRSQGCGRTFTRGCRQRWRNCRLAGRCASNLRRKPAVIFRDHEGVCEGFRNGLKADSTPEGRDALR